MFGPARAKVVGVMLPGILLFGSVGCPNSRLARTTQEMDVNPSELTFPPTAVGYRSQQSLTLRSLAQGTLDIHIRVEAPFSVEQESITLLAGQELHLNVLFEPATEQEWASPLVFEWSEGERVVLLQATGVALPPCSPQPCYIVEREETGACQYSLAPDETPCSSPCLTEARCFEGQCNGTPAVCEDHNACTHNACNELQGCVFPPIACQASDNPCLAPRCDPQTGCGTSPVPDGNVCVLDACNVGACLGGACHTSALPDGTTCVIPGTACATDAICQTGKCLSPSASTRKPGDMFWSVPRVLGPLAVDEDGASYFRTDFQELKSVDVCGVERWKVSLQPLRDYSNQGGDVLMLTGRLVIVGEFNRVSAFSRSDGSLQWTREVRSLFGLCPRGWEECPDGLRTGSFYLRDATVSPSGKIRLNAMGTLLGEEAKDTHFFAQLHSNGSIDWTRAFEGPTNMLSVLIEGPEETLYFSGPSRRVIDSRGSVVQGAVPSHPEYFSVAVGRGELISVSHSSEGETTSFQGLPGRSWPSLYPGLSINVLQHTLADETGAIFIPTGTEDIHGVQRVTPSGVSVLGGWSQVIQSMLLGAQRALYVLLGSTDLSAPAQLLCIDADTGDIRWWTAVGTNHLYRAEMALTSNGTLLVLRSGTLQAYWTGTSVGYAPTASWPRHRGNNANTSRVDSTP